MRRNLEESKKFFSGDKFALHTGIEILEVGDFYAKCKVTLQDFHKNCYGHVMGGVIFTLADFTYAVASDSVAVSLTSEINYLASSKGSELIAEAKVVKDGRSTVFYEIEITDDLGKKIAFVTMTGFKVQ